MRPFLVALCVLAPFAQAHGGNEHAFRLYDDLASTVVLHLGDESRFTRVESMEKIDYGIWEVRMPLAPGDYVYQYEIDGQWRVSDLNVPEHRPREDGSVVSALRINDTAEEVSEGAVHHPVRIEYEGSGAARVQVAGEFTGWSARTMRPVGGHLWRTEFDLPAGQYGYKFIVDGQWVMDPRNPDVKVVGGVSNSSLLVSGDLSHTVRSDQEDDEATEGVEGGVTVPFTVYAPVAERVSLVGTMNDWNDQRHPMRRTDTGIWQGHIPLAPGTYEYKFKVDDQWWLDINNPNITATGDARNSILVVHDRAQPEQSEPLDIISLQDPSQAVLLGAGTGLHPFQQELLRAYIHTALADGHGVSVQDGTLNAPLDLPQPHDALSLEWDVEMWAATPHMVLRHADAQWAFSLPHPLVAPPTEWLARLRAQANAVVPAVEMAWTTEETPPPDSDWAGALRTRDTFLPFAAVHAVNRMSAYGRTHGWSRALMRDVAVTYADLADDFRFPSTGGRAIPLFAARAVAYADLARDETVHDETLAYVLARIGRPGDALTFLPPEPETIAGRLARAYVFVDPEPLITWIDDEESALSDADKGRIRRAAAEIQQRDHQTTLAALTLDRHLNDFPHDVAAMFRARAWGGVSSGHRYANRLVFHAADPALWTAVLEGLAPALSDSRAAHADMGDHVARNTLLASSALEEGLRVDDAAIPQRARWMLLKDSLDAAAWTAARFYGRQLSSRPGAERLLEQLAPWSEFSPTVAVFVRTHLRRPMNDRAYGTMRRGLTDSGFGPHSMALMNMVKQTYTTWLFDEGQSFHRQTPFPQSDVVKDYLEGWHIHSQSDELNHRARLRALDPMAHHGYPDGGQPPTPDDLTEHLPEALSRSYGMNVRMGEAWRWQRGPKATEHAIAFYRRAMEIQPNETEPYTRLINLLLKREEYAEVLRLVDDFPDTTEGLQRVAAERAGLWAALGLGQTQRAQSLARVAAGSWQAAALRNAAALYEILGDQEAALEYYNRVDERYGGHLNSIYHHFRHQPEIGRAMMEEDLAWLEDVTDERLYSSPRGFSFNEFIHVPYYYWCIGKPDRALWFLKPQAEGIQKGYTWFFLMTMSRLLNDREGFELARHVLGDHVGDDYGEFARYLRGDRSWHDVMEAVRHHGHVQYIYTLAAILAEERGDEDLASRMRYHVLSPRRGTRSLFSMAWKALEEHGEDPLAFLQRRFIGDDAPESPQNETNIGPEDSSVPIE